MTSRFEFYWTEQKGRCALMITNACRQHGGQMIQRAPDMSPHRQPKSMPTWDHIYPKPRTAEQEPLQLLACRACNNARGSAPARAEYVARAMVVLEEWVKTNPTKPRGVPRARRERARVQAAAQLAAQNSKQRRHAERANNLKAMQAEVDAPAPVDHAKHPHLPRAGYDQPLSRRATNNAESQAAALKGIAERMRAKGDKHGANMITAKAEGILAAVRGKPPERK